MIRFLLLSALACGEAERAALPEQSPPPYSVTGTEALRLTPREADVGARFPWYAPMVMEFTVPAGVVIPGRGLPAGLGAVAGEPILPPAEDASILQLELPASPYGRTDEEQDNGTSGSFDPPRLCPVGAPCLWGADVDGRWRAWRVRSVGGVEVAMEVQLDHAWPDEAPDRAEAAWRVLTVWLAEGEALEPGDRVTFSYVGQAPRRSTDWLPGVGLELKARLRWRIDGTDSAGDCLGAWRTCWQELPPADVQGMTLHPLAPKFAQVVAPLDAVTGAEVAGHVVFLDEHSNPSPADGTLRLTIAGQDAIAPAPINGRWKVPFSLPSAPQGLHQLTPVTSTSMNALPQYVNVVPGELAQWSRRVGDIHMHTGQSGGPSFALSSIEGDHRGNFTRGDDALRYLREVAGHDFGAMSEHSWRYRAWVPPADPSPFGPGGPCEISPAALTDDYDWWTLSQQIAWTFQSDNPAFTVFPAYEWHGNFRSGGHNADLHRVVLFRDHDPAAFDLPMLPGATPDRGPQCLFRFLDDEGLDPSRVLVIPHMMFARQSNDDWALSYQPVAPFDTLTTPRRAFEYQTVAEIFSARNHGPVALDPTSAMSLFEGNGGATLPPYALQHGWRDVAAVFGVIAASDNHVQTPGSDDLWVQGSGTSSHAHEPGGAAFVLADPALPARDAIFDALRNRRTYATSGPRIWADFQASADGVRYPMGSEVGPVTASSATLYLTVASPRTVRAATVLGAQVGASQAWTQVATWQGVNRTQLIQQVSLTNPVPPGGAPQTWVYYLRAFTGFRVPAGATAQQRNLFNQDAVWTSPIWITWSG